MVAYIFEIADSIIYNSKDPIILGCAHYYKGRAEIEYGQFEIAHRSFEKAITLFEPKRYSLGLTLSHSLKGELYIDQNKGKITTKSITNK